MSGGCGKKIEVDYGNNFYICGEEEIYSKYTLKVIDKLSPFRLCFNCEEKNISKKEEINGKSNE